MSSHEEQEYIWGKLVPELQQRMEDWATEYKQPRELGVAGEFVGLHRKVGKLKTIVWDNVDASSWREDPETITFEVIAHALLMLHDMRHGCRPRMVDPEPDLPTYQEEAERRARHLTLEAHPSQRTHEFRGQTHHNHPGKTCEEWWMLTEDEKRA